MVEKLSSLKRENRELKFIMVLFGIVVFVFAVAWSINSLTLNSKIVYKIEQLKEYNITEDFFNCSDGSYFRATGDYVAVSSENITCVKNYENKTIERWVDIDELKDFQEFTDSKYCKAGSRSRECRRSPDCCIASTYGLRYMSNPINTLKAYCVLDHEDKDMYVCGEFNVYVDTLKNLNKKQRVWFK